MFRVGIIGCGRPWKTEGATGMGIANWHALGYEASPDSLVERSPTKDMRQFAIGMDIGGTKIAAGVVDRKANIIARHTVTGHNCAMPEHVLACVEGAYESLLDQSGIRPEHLAGVGLGFAGHVNGKAGIVITSSNLPGWDHVPLRDIVQERLGVPVVLENDTKLNGLAEYMYGAGQGVDNMCYVTVSTGYGLAIIIDGELYTGHIGTAGEIGHTVVDVNGSPCSCGKRGCLMAYTSGIGLARMAREKIAGGAETMLREMYGGDPARLTGRLIAEAAGKGDAVARELITTAGYYAGVGLSTIVQVVNPELIVIGGGLIHIGPTFMEPCLQGLRENVHPTLFESVRIVPWQLGDDSGVLGAAAKAFVTFDEQAG
jgi:glucokinase